MALLALPLLTAACGDGDTSPVEMVADARRDQAEDLARQAKLSKDVQEFLGLAAEAAAATFTVTYDRDGKATTLTQKLPARRIDVRTATGTESFLRLRDGAYACKQEGAGPWSCTTADDSRDDPDLGVFAPHSLTKAVDALARSRSTHDFAVVGRSMLGVKAQCLITTPKLEGDVDGVPPDELCVAPDGVILRVRTASQDVTATRYSPRVDAAVLRLPAPAAAPAPSG